MHALALTLVLAAQKSFGDQLRQVPKHTWINLGICLLALVVVVRLWRGLKRFNDYAPWFAATLASCMIFFYWVYNRTEPRFLTPIVEQLSNFLPTKSKHERDLERLRKSRD